MTCRQALFWTIHHWPFRVGLPMDEEFGTSTDIPNLFHGQGSMKKNRNVQMLPQRNLIGLRILLIRIGQRGFYVGPSSACTHYDAAVNGITGDYRDFVLFEGLEHDMKSGVYVRQKSCQRPIDL
jgi:hypothetical protein